MLIDNPLCPILPAKRYTAQMNEETLLRQRQPRLPIGCYRARFEAATAVRMSEFPGSAWRGALGHALKRTVCVTHLSQCRQCTLYHSCAYPYFYDTPPPPGAPKMRHYETAPHPFVLEPGEAGGQTYTLGFTLIGQANRHLSLFIHALVQAAAGPKGVAGNRLALLAIEQETEPGSRHWEPIHRPGERLAALPAVCPDVPDVPTACRIVLLTPLRVKREGRHVGPVGFRFADMFGHLLRRVSMLSAFHTDTPLEADFRALMERARQVQADIDLVWRDMTRYSHRQQAVMQLGGVLGHIDLTAADLDPFWPYLWLGQWLHAGSGATMGLGRYRIEAASLQAQ